MVHSIPEDAEFYLDEYDAERFWAHVNRRGGRPYVDDPLATAEGECWLWADVDLTSGYGRFKMFGKWLQAHRVSYRDFGRDIPEGFHLDHLCRIHKCVNPAHLEAVTRQVNLSRGIRGQATHCKHGHEYTDENTRVVTKGDTASRLCRACRKTYARNLYLRRKAAA